MDYTGKIISKNPPQPTQASASGVWTLDEAAAAVKNNSWPIPGVPNPVSKSLRFNSADSAYLNRTPGSAGNRRTWTWSGWVKLGKIANWGGLFNAGTSGDQFAIYLFTDSTLYIQDFVSPANNIQIQPTQVFRDPSAWYHIVVAIDTTQATSSNRVKVYINGSQVTAFSTSTYPSQNYDTQVNSTSFAHNVGRNFQFATSTAKYFDGYMTEVNFIDGQALTPSSFGQTNANTGVWEPKPYTGSYGTNGFYLNFKDSATTTALGYDYSGNGNNWTPNNFSVTAGAGNDSLVDVPTQWIGYNTSGDTGGIWRGNYATLSPIASSFGFASSGTPTISNGNLTSVSSAQNAHQYLAPFGLSSGKWYWEITLNSTPTELEIGVTGEPFTDLNSPFATGEGARSWTAFPYGVSGQVYNNNVAASGTFIASAASGDVLRIAVDMDNGKIFWGKNGTWTNSADPAAGTGFSHSNLTGTVVPAFGQSGSGYSYSFDVNFGQRPFAYAPPAGFLSLCTTNLPTPTIGATSTTQAGKYFNTVLYTGTGSSLGVTGVGFQPDWTWIKSRSAATDHGLYDAVRGVQKQLESNNTNAETTETTGLTAFNSDGFTVGALAQLNTSSATYASWNWKANGAGSSNTAGSISSTVSANTTAGFSIVTYTGTGANATVGHGCLVNNVATAPSFIICKERNTAGYDWRCYHASLGATKYIDLNSNAAAATASTIWQDTAPTTTVFSVGTNGSVNVNTGAFVAYCFAPVAGYSAFGSYTGNGSSDGPFVYTGFRPAYVMIKYSSGTADWIVLDKSRPGYNVIGGNLYPNGTYAEDTQTKLDFTSNGFKIRADGTNANVNVSSGTYIYAAFAEFPLKFSLAR